MLAETITLEAAIKFAKPTAEKIYKKSILPAIENNFKNIFTNRVELEKLKKYSVKYISKLTGQCSTINTIAFQNTPKKLTDLYIPLTLDDGNISTEMLVDDNCDIFQNHNLILINDTAGMGKSTLAKKVLLNIIQGEEYIPIYLELRKVDANPFEEVIANELGINTSQPMEVIDKLPFVFIFDGLDEVDNNLKKTVINNILKFSEHKPNTKVLVTSRKETYLSELYNFKRFAIKPLETHEAYDLINKCDPSGLISSKLIDGIHKSQDQGILDFLSTPLYVSLLFCSYRYKTIIPQKKYLFYSQVYDALFESHDLSKEVGFVRPKFSNLDSAEFHSVLRRLAFTCLKKGGKIEFQKDELEILVEQILENMSSISCSASSFVKDLTSTVPLFIKFGSTIRWSHKSLMEYFASMFICNDAKTKQKDLLLHFYNHDSWSSYENVFELCADIDYVSFKSSIIKASFTDFIAFNDKNTFHDEHIPQQEINNRMALDFLVRGAFQYVKSDIINNFNIMDAPEEDFKSRIDSRYDRFQHNLYSLKHRPIHFIFSLSKEAILNNIIKQKEPGLFLSFPKLSFSDIEAISKSALQSDTLYLLSDNPQILSNTSENYIFINKILLISDVAIFDIDKVKKELVRLNLDCSDGIDSLLDIL